MSALYYMGLFTYCVFVFLVVWYVDLPPRRRREINRKVLNLFCRHSYKRNRFVALNFEDGKPTTQCTKCGKVKK